MHLFFLDNSAPFPVELLCHIIYSTTGVSRHTGVFNNRKMDNCTALFLLYIMYVLHIVQMRYSLSFFYDWLSWMFLFQAHMPAGGLGSLCCLV